MSADSTYPAEASSGRPGPSTVKRTEEHVFAARAAAAIVGAFVACYWKVDPDLWGHLRFGLDTIRDRRLESVDPYSFTSDIPWINHEWLSEVATGAAYLAGGTAGLWLLKTALVAGSFVLLALGLRRVAEPARWRLLTVAMLSTAPIASTLRPQLWTVLFLSVLLVTRTWPTIRIGILWPVLFALWANLHGGWIVGLGVLGASSAGLLLDRADRRTYLPFWGVSILCVAATLLTPYGLDLWRFICGTVGLGRDIEEWRAVWERDYSALALWLMVAATVVVTLRRTGWSWTALLPVLMLGIASVKVMRLIGLFGLSAAVLLGTRWPDRPRVRLQRAALAILLLVALIPASVVSMSSVRCLPITGYWAPDLVAASALSNNHVHGRLMVPFNWGQFAIWHFSPRLKVSMDGRRETVYSAGRLEEQVALDRGDPSIVRFIRDERPEYVWLPLPESAALIPVLQAEGYRQDVQTPRSTILVRRDLEVLVPTTTISGCFP